MKPIYKIKSSNKKDPYQTVIEVVEPSEFTFAQLRESKAKLEKAQTELDGQLKLERAKLENILKNYPKELENFARLKGEAQMACYIYVESSKKVKFCLEQLNHCKKAFKQHADELKEIKVQTGFEIVEEKPKKC